MVVRVSWHRRRALVYPIQPPPKTAILVPWFRSSGVLRVFRDGWTEEAAAFAPRAIAGTLAQLDALTGMRIPSLSHAVIVLTHPGEPRLTESDHNRFWFAFRVPVFEQIIGERGELLAAECEAHGGLHIESENPPLGEMKIDDSPCGCGRKTPRLVPADSRELLRSVAVYAR
jgi:hypothetical protein